MLELVETCWVFSYEVGEDYYCVILRLSEVTGDYFMEVYKNGDYVIDYPKELIEEVKAMNQFLTF